MLVPLALFPSALITQMAKLASGTALAPLFPVHEGARFADAEAMITRASGGDFKRPNLGFGQGVLEPKYLHCRAG